MKRTMSAMVEIVLAAKLEELANARKLKEPHWTVSKEIERAIREHVELEATQ